jgi:hypothetical protein
MIAWTASGTLTIGHDVREYRWHQRVIAEFNARMPQPIVGLPYNPAVGERLIGEAAGCILTIVVVTMGIRRRRGPVRVRVKWIAARPRAAVSATATPDRAEPARKASSGSQAADRLSAVVWHDHVARVEKEHT